MPVFDLRPIFKGVEEAFRKASGGAPSDPPKGGEKEKPSSKGHGDHENRDLSKTSSTTLATDREKFQREQKPQNQGGPISPQPNPGPEAGASTPLYSGYSWISPLEGFHPGKRDFGMHFHPIHQVNKMHTGDDWGAPHGTPIQAPDRGKVIFAGPKGGYGNCIIVSHGQDANGREISTLFGHCSSINVRVGQEISQGEVVGKVGMTGTATGDHLHFEVRVNGKPTDPKPYYDAVVVSPLMADTNAEGGPPGVIHTSNDLKNKGVDPSSIQMIDGSKVPSGGGTTSNTANLDPEVARLQGKLRFLMEGGSDPDDASKSSIGVIDHMYVNGLRSNDTWKNVLKDDKAREEVLARLKADGLLDGNLREGEINSIYLPYLSFKKGGQLPTSVEELNKMIALAEKYVSLAKFVEERRATPVGAGGARNVDYSGAGPNGDGPPVNLPFTSADGRTFQATASFYHTKPPAGYSSAKEKRMEGGDFDRKGRRLKTIEDAIEEQLFQGKELEYAIACDSGMKDFPYGTKVFIALPDKVKDHYEKKYGRKIDWTKLNGRLVDTGQAFEGRGTGRVDICLRGSDESQKLCNYFGMPKIAWTKVSDQGETIAA